MRIAISRSKMSRHIANVNLDARSAIRPQGVDKIETDEAETRRCVDDTTFMDRMAGLIEHGHLELCELGRKIHAYRDCWQRESIW